MGRRKRIRVLVVDDEEVIRTFLMRLFNLEGIQARVATNGSEAVALAAQEKFDMIFVDMRMPGIDGIETLKQLKKLSPESKCVMMTGYSLDELLKKTEGQAVQAIITKPFDINEIVSLLDDCARDKFGEEITSVLVVETEDAVSGFLKKLLKGYAVTVVATAQEALVLLEHKEFDLIVSDIMLKDMPGADLYARIRDRWPDAKVILVSGDAEKTDSLVKSHLYRQIKSLLE